MIKSDRLLIHWVGVGVLACGIVVLISPTVGRIALNFIFLFYILIRFGYYRKIWKGPFTASDKQRLILAAILTICVLLNFIGLSESYFLPIFLLMLEYLSIMNRERQTEKKEDQ